MFKFLSRVLGGSKESKPKLNGRDHGHDVAVEVPPEVQEIRKQKAQARAKSDRAEIQLEKAHDNHRATVFSANATFSGLNTSEKDQKELDRLKAKWLEDNKAPGTATA